MVCFAYIYVIIEHILPPDRPSGTLYRPCHSALMLHVSNRPSGTLYRPCHSALMLHVSNRPSGTWYRIFIHYHRS